MWYRVSESFAERVLLHGPHEIGDTWSVASTVANPAKEEVPGQPLLPLPALPGAAASPVLLQPLDRLGPRLQLRRPVALAWQIQSRFRLVQALDDTEPHLMRRMVPGK